MADRAVNDPKVYNQAYAVLEQRNTPQVIRVAWAEAGLVESNFTNHKTATNFDSVGYLQQRPSQGWKNPTNVVTATNSFLDAAAKFLASNPNATPEQIAQGVQRSALPGEYGKVRDQAIELLAASDDDPSAWEKFKDSLPDADTLTIPGFGGDSVMTAALGALLERIGKAADAFTSKAKIAESIVTSVTKLFLPSNLLRAAAGGIGVIVLCFSVFFLGRELRA
jgi:hypothetical protein